MVNMVSSVYLLLKFTVPISFCFCVLKDI
jgi:hypothetical protein